jgi:hypothetical protein
MELTDFEIVKIIMHLVPGGAIAAAGARGVTLCEAEVSLEKAEKTFLEDRIRSALTDNARPVEEDPSLVSDTPILIKNLLSGSGDFIQNSQTIAVTLFTCQPPISPGGLLVLIEGRVEGSNCVLVAKLEHEEGVRVEQIENDSGHLTYRTEYLKNLILGEGTKVFKVGIFDEVGEDHRLRGNVIDVQHGRHGVASYFLEGVLGCRFVERADVNTQRFFVASEKWFNSLSDVEKSARYEIALLAEMQSSERNLSPRIFATRHLDVEDRDTFMTEMKIAAPMAKVVTLIAPQIKRVKIQTFRHASVFVPPEMYEDGSLTVSQADENGSSEISLRDAIKSISGAGGKKSKSSG